VAEHALDPQALDDLARIFALAALDELLREAAALTVPEAVEVT
jgi:hypothetical protein